MADTKTELFVATGEKPTYYVDIGNNYWIDDAGQRYTTAELALSIQKRAQEEEKQRQAGMTAVFVKGGNQPIVTEPAPGTKDVLNIKEAIHIGLRGIKGNVVSDRGPSSIRDLMNQQRHNGR